MPEQADTPVMAPRRRRSVTQPMVRPGHGTPGGGRAAGRSVGPVLIARVRSRRRSGARPQAPEGDLLEPGPVLGEQVLDRAGQPHLAPGPARPGRWRPARAPPARARIDDRDAVLAGRLRDRGHEVVPAPPGRARPAGSSSTSRPGRAGQRDRDASCAFCPPERSPTFCRGGMPSRSSRPLARRWSKRRFRRRATRSMSATGRFR